jgi:hypothetical protein
VRLARASFILATLAVLWPVRSDAYRPFDQTDADVAGPKEFEFELGPVIFQHGPRGNAWAPSFVLNLGLVRDLELVVDGNGFVRLGPLPMDAERWVATSALQVKFVVREGSLQDASGPSIALEGGVLFPSIPHGSDWGASLAAIFSERWGPVTVHFNLQVERDLVGAWEVLGGAIVEGPFRWAVRPVGEVYVGQSTNGTTLSSFLVGAIWRVSEAISLDAAVRFEPHSAGAVWEGRLGFTWSTPL